MDRPRRHVRQRYLVAKIAALAGIVAMCGIYIWHYQATATMTREYGPLPPSEQRLQEMFQTTSTPSR
jgi:hypothetical protein